MLYIFSITQHYKLIADIVRYIVHQHDQIQHKSVLVKNPVFDSSSSCLVVLDALRDLSVGFLLRIAHVV